MSMIRLTLNRRRLLGGAAAAAAIAVAGRVVAQPAAPISPTSSGTKIVLLGTKGGPRVGGARSNPACALLVGGVPYVVDCGQGVARQLVAAGVSLAGLRNVFVTHMHSDHELELGGLVYDAWATGLQQTIDVWGPPGIAAMVAAFMESMKMDIDIRIVDESKPDLRKLVVAHEIAKDGLVMRNAEVKVTAVHNQHPPIKDSYALRFDTADRSVVFSGDTTRSDDVVALARGADVLVHEALYVPGVDAMVKRVPNAATLREHLMASHTTTEDVGRVAAAARVKTLVMTHFVPGDDPSITDAMWAEGARKHFDGEIIVGRDLMVI